VTVQGDRVSVRPARAAPATDAARSPGWLVDLGDPQTRKPDEPAPRAIRLLWSGPAEFSVGVDVELSDDLRQWRPGGSGQLLALTSSSGPLLQDRVLLPARPTRFVRLVWSDAAAAPLLSAAKAILNRPSSVILDVPTEIVVSASPEVLRQDADAASVALAKRAMHFDLGGALPVVQIDLQFDAVPDSGTRIAPVRLQSRSREGEPWHEVAGHVFFRIERGGAVSTSPPLTLHTTLRYLRIVPDERAAPIDAAQTRLIAQAQLASLVFATQGRAPYTLFAGSAKAPSGALPIATLVPALDEERPRFGRASLGAWRESEQVVRQIQSQQRLAALRPWLLWAVLLAGVVGLGFMVWQLARRPTRDRNRTGPQPR
jgi:hypothetical protein